MDFKYGVYTVIPTYFLNGNVDYTKICDMIELQISSGIKNIVLLGTTSETPTLTQDEQDMIVNTVWNKFKGKVNIIVGIGGNNTKDTLQQAFNYREKSDALMATVPYYNKPSQEGIYQHFATIAQLLEDKPIMLYNIPSRCGVSVEPSVIADLYNNFENIKAIKEASGNIQQTLQIKNLCDIVVLSGDDVLTLPLLSVGAEGVVSVASNIIPKYLLKLVELFKKGDIESSIKLNKKLYPIFKNLFIDTNPVPLKYLMVKLSMINDDSVRLPLVKINSDEKLEILDRIASMINELNSSELTFSEISF